jgi:DNA-binding response OmpR family regulator
MAKIIKILIVEDDEATQYICEFTLHNEGYQVTLAANIAEARTALAKKNFNLVLLDLNLPDGNGMSLVRYFSSQPFLIMTVSATPQERYQGFKAGAKDYLIKPFHPGELMHRIKNLLVKEPDKSENSLQFGKCLLNLATHTFSQAGYVVELTRGEFALLAVLARAKGKVISRDTLLKSIARESGDGHPRTVDVLISRLRKKIENEPRKPSYVLTVPGLGYRLVDTV